MKTQIRPETVRFGVVIQCCRNWAFVKTQTNAEIRLYWSQLRLVECELGHPIFSTGQKRRAHKGEKIIYVPLYTSLKAEGGWLWGFKDEYDRVLDATEEIPHDCPYVTKPPPAPEINLDKELAALGNDRVRAFQRRYGGLRRTIVYM